MKKKFFTFLTILVVIITASTACFGAEENSKNENTQDVNDNIIGNHMVTLVDILKKKQI